MCIRDSFRAKKSNGRYRYFWLYRVKFGIPATNLTTKGDSITFSPPTIEGTILRRNKVDTQGRHPGKAEVTEGDKGCLLYTSVLPTDGIPVHAALIVATQQTFHIEFDKILCLFLRG